MDNDDQPVGRILSRREVLALFGTVGAAWLVGCAPSQSGSDAPTSAAGQASSAATPAVNAEAATSASVAATTAPTAAANSGATATGAATAAAATGGTPSCVVSPALTEGPYFVDEKLNRSDIRSDPTSGAVKEGLPLALTMRVSQINSSGCTPLAGAVVDIWHCDAQGIYSDVSDRSQGFDTVGQKFLRGRQVTDANGTVQFTTIYPGWYSGRAVHIHFKVRNDAGGGQTHEFTSQLFFDESISNAVYAQAPYAGKGRPDTPNSRDGIYGQGGQQLLIALTPSGQGYSGTFDVGLDLG